jgi:hypothetical protein
MVKKLETPISITEVGVLLLGFNRPELLKKRINEIYESKVENLYISIDGGSESHTLEMDLLKQYAQEKLSKIHRFSLHHHRDNLGLVRHITGEISNVLTKHQYIIVIEDDVKISLNFINNMINGLNINKRDNLLGIVSGFSPIHFKHLQNKWRISRYPYIWGWACSKAAWESYTYNLSEVNIEQKLLHSKSWNNLKPSQKIKWLRLFRKAQVNPLETWDSQLVFLSYCKDFTNLAPIFSMVGNEGFNDPRAIHTKGKKPKFVTTLNVNHAIITKKSKYLNRILNFFDKYWMNDF